MKKIETGLVDLNNKMICCGDILLNTYGYLVFVYQDNNDKKFYGSLICPVGDSCKNIPYSLGEDYQRLIVISREELEKINEETNWIR